MYIKMVPEYTTELYLIHLRMWKLKNFFFFGKIVLKRFSPADGMASFLDLNIIWMSGCSILVYVYKLPLWAITYK